MEESKTDVTAEAVNLTTREEMLYILLTRFYSGNRVAWHRAAREFPEWKGRFSTPAARAICHQEMQVLRKKLEARGWKTAEGIAAQVMEEYVAPDGTVECARALAEHPEWAAAFGKHPAEDLWHMVRRLRMRSAGVAVPPGLRGGLIPVWYVRKDKAAVAYTDGVPYCPHCGRFIQAWNRAYNVGENRGRNLEAELEEKNRGLKK